MFKKPHKSPTQQQGYEAENTAVAFLRKQGLTICTTNFRCKMGEIDIIAKDATTLVFAEVRYRKNVTFGTPAETVTFSKRKKLIRASQYYLQRHNPDLPCRFDIVEIYGANHQTNINWVKDAFQCS